MSYYYVKTSKDLALLCEKLADCDRLAIDTEFVGDRTYFRRLEIIQVAAPGIEAIIDYPAITGGRAEPSRMRALWKLFQAPRPQLVFHAVTEDARVLREAMGDLPCNIFDTQAAWSLLDQRYQIGYLDLVETLCGVRLDKGPQMLDWSMRPLTNEMIDYALNDVRHLLMMHDILTGRLQEAGRLEWLGEIIEDILSEVEPPNSREAWRKVKGAGGMNGRQTAVLRELAAWRERLAMERDEPVQRIMTDDIIVAVARKAPRHESALRQITRRLTEGQIRTYGKAMLQAVEAGLVAEPPERDSNGRPSGEHVKGLSSLLASYVEAVARQQSIAGGRLARTFELQMIADDPADADQRQLRVLTGWRRTMVGDDLLAIARGELALHWDPAEQLLVATRRS